MLIVLREARDIAQVGDVLCVQWYCVVVALSIIQHKKHFGDSRWRVQNSNSVTEKTSESFWWKCCVLRLLMNENCTVHFCIVSNVICLIQSWGRQDRETIFHTFFFVEIWRFLTVSGSNYLVKRNFFFYNGYSSINCDFALGLETTPSFFGSGI